MIPEDARHVTDTSPSPDEVAQSQAQVRDLREKILANPRARAAYERLGGEIDAHMAAKRKPPLKCLHCHKEVYEDGWSAIVTVDESTISPEWGPAVCFIDDKGFLREHKLDDATVSLSLDVPFHWARDWNSTEDETNLF